MTAPDTRHEMRRIHAWYACVYIRIICIRIRSSTSHHVCVFLPPSRFLGICRCTASPRAHTSRAAAATAVCYQLLPSWMTRYARLFLANERAYYYLGSPSSACSLVFKGSSDNAFHPRALKSKTLLIACGSQFCAAAVLRMQGGLASHHTRRIKR